MGSFSLWFLKLALKCIDNFAWPLLALGYPLCASVQAIETDSYQETRDLISYWILFSLIYLFEYAFLKLLEWFQFWPYIKLMIIFWLIIPDFGRASYVYNHLIHSCISMKPQAVISWLKNWNKLFVKKEDFLLQAERYIKDNGSEAMEKLIASKNTTHNPDAEATDAIKATEKKEMQQINGKRLHTEHNDIKDLEVIEEREVPVVKQDNPAVPNVALNQNTSSAMVETKGMVGKDQAGGELPQSSTHKNVQKEWTCAICQVTTQSEITLNSHLNGRKHRATCEALKAKNQPVPLKFVPVSVSRKDDPSSEEMNEKNTINQHANIEQKNIQISNAKEHATKNGEHEKSMLNDAVKQRTSNDMENKSTGYQKGVQEAANKSDQLNAKTNNGGSTLNNELKGKTVVNREKVQGLQKNLGKPVGMKHSKLMCEICNVTCPNEGALASHLNGKKHLAQIKIISEAGVLQKNLGKPVGMKHSKVMCEICNVTCPNEGALASHLKGKKHLAQIKIICEAGVL